MKRVRKSVGGSLRKDRRKRAQAVTGEIEAKLEIEQDIIVAFDVLKRWYKKFTGVSMKPSREDTDERKGT